MLRTTLVAALCALLCLTGNAFAQTPINDIQVYDDLGAPASPLAGTVQTIRGVIYVPAGKYNAGTHYIQDASGGMSFYDDSGITLLSPGDVAEVQGTVSVFQGEIQLSNVVANFIEEGTEYPPLVLEVSEAIDYDGDGLQSAGDYEIVGTKVQVTGTVTYDLTGATFDLVDLTDVTDRIPVYIDSTTQIDFSGVNEGDLYQITSPMVNFNGLLELKPANQADLVENPENPPPLVENITPNPWSPDPNDAVLVSAQITDNGGIQSASLFYAYGGSGLFTELAMSNTFGDFYEATIPGTTEASIEYYVVAEDNTGQITSVPGDAPVSTLLLAVGLTSIYDIQEDRDETGASNYTGQTVNVEGIVTLAPGELNSQGSQWIIETPEGGPWSGLFVFEGSGSNILFRGDRVRISGLVNEFSGTTQILPQAPEAVTLIDFNNPAPPIVPISSTEADTNEKWENVIVRTFMSTVLDTIPASDNFTIIDTTSDSTVVVDPLFAVVIEPEPDDTLILTAFMDGRFGVNELSPRDDLDFKLFATDVENPLPQRKQAYLSSIHPNPFNPRTKIEFSLPRRGLAELAVFNARGERVTVLASGEMDGGDHFRTWNGIDSNGQAVSSGVYYVRLRFETESVSVQKATLVK